MGSLDLLDSREGQEKQDQLEGREAKDIGGLLVSRDFLGQLDHLVRRGPLGSLAKMEWQGLLVPGDPLVLMELWGPWA